MGKYTDPDWANSALITIDVQRDFALPGAPAYIGGTMEVVPVMQRLVRAFREAGKPIVHVVRLYRADGSNVDVCRKEAVEEGGSLAVRPGSDGAELVDELKPSPEVRLETEPLLYGEVQGIGDKEWVMYKPRWGAFYETQQLSAGQRAVPSSTKWPWRTSTSVLWGYCATGSGATSGLLP